MEIFIKIIVTLCKEYQLPTIAILIALLKVQLDANKRFFVREKEVDGKFELQQLRSKNNEERSRKAESKSQEALDGLKNMESDVSCIKKDVADIRIKLDEKFERLIDGKEKKMFKEEINKEEESSTKESCEEEKKYTSERTPNYWHR